MSRQVEYGAFRCVPPRSMGNLTVIGKLLEPLETSLLHVLQKHFQRVGIVCPVRCPENGMGPAGGAEKV